MAEKRELSPEEYLKLRLDLLFSKYVERELADDQKRSVNISSLWRPGSIPKQ